MISEIEANTIKATSTEKLRQYVDDDDFSGLTRAVIRAELARREQAQAAGNNALMTEAAQKIDELRAERDNARRVAVTMGNERSRLESILDDLQAECVRRSDTIHSLTAENARLRSLLEMVTKALKEAREAIK